MRRFPPERIVCLTEETVETLYLLGEQGRIVGVSGYAVRPPQVRREKPRVSAFTSADIPKILALAPDLVLAFSDMQAGIVADLARAGVAVHAAGIYVDPSLPGYGNGRAKAVTDTLQQDMAPLAEREREILRSVAYGYTSKEIAARLASTPKAVEAQKARACSRLGIISRAQIVQFAILQGWLQGELSER